MNNKNYCISNACVVGDDLKVVSLSLVISNKCRLLLQSNCCDRDTWAWTTLCAVEVEYRGRVIQLNLITTHLVALLLVTEAASDEGFHTA